MISDNIYLQNKQIAFKKKYTLYDVNVMTVSLLLQGLLFAPLMAGMTFGCSLTDLACYVTVSLYH